MRYTIEIWLHLMEIEHYKSAVQSYLNVCRQKRLDKNTIKRKTEILTRLQIFLNDQPFSAETANSFLQSLDNIEDSTRELYGRIIRGFVTYCYDEDLITKNWRKKVILPKLHRNVIEVVSEEMAMKIIEVGTTPGKFENGHARRSKIETRLALQFMLLTGCRVNEVEQMKGSDMRLDAEEPFVYIHSKGGDTEMQPLPQSMLGLLRERQGNERLVLFTKRTANKLLDRGSKQLGVQIETTCHRLRDIFALTRLRRGIAMQLVSRALRHKSVKTTDRYYSNYILSDIAPVVNNSNIVKQKLSPDQLLEELMTLVQKTGLHMHEEFVLNVKKEGRRVQITASFD